MDDDISRWAQLERDFAMSEQKYLSLVTQSPVGIALINEQGQLVEWNQSMVVLTGLPADQVLGRDIWEVEYQLFTPQAKAKFSQSELEANLRKLLAEGKAASFGKPVSFKLSRSDGEERFVEMLRYPVATAQGFLLGAVAIDVTGRVRAEADAGRQAIRSQALARAAARLQGPGDLPGMLAELCAEIMEQMGVDGAAVSLYHETGHMFELAATHGLPAHFIESFQLVPYDQYFQEGDDLVQIEDVAQVSGLVNAQLYPHDQLRSMSVIRLQQDDLLLGAICVYHRCPAQALSPDQISLLHAFAALASVALERQHSMQQLMDASERLRVMSRRLIEVQENESRHIARELHDQIGQNLTFLKMLLTTAPETLPATQEPHDQAKEIVDTLLSQIRALALDLRPSLLDDLGLLPALLALFERLESRAGIKVNFAHSRIDRRYSSEIETTVYRVVQEALTNAARHAGVKEAWVRIWNSKSSLYFQVEDLGAGFEYQAGQYRDTFGLLGMRERVELCSGGFEVDSQPGQGTRITAWVPLGEEDGGECHGNLDYSG